MAVKFENYSIKCTNAMNKAVITWLYEASGEIESAAARNTAVDTGQLKGSWDTSVDEAQLIAKIGSPLENALWEEFGTGQWALNNNGRKTPWHYVDRHGHWHTTTGKRPRRMLHIAFEMNKRAIQERLKTILKGMK